MAAALLSAGLAAPVVPAAAQVQLQIPDQPAPQGQAPQGQAPQGQAPQGQAPAGQGPATAPEPERFGDWVRRCTPNPPKDASPPKEGEQVACFITQQLVDQNSQRPLLKITIGFFRPNRQPMAVIAMPLGVPLAGGVQVGVDGKGIAGAPFQFCRVDGCQAYLPLSAEVLNSFRAGNQGVIQLHANKNQPINMQFSLSGFTAGFGSIE
ncbi:invasion associated locus B family protein [Pelagibius marinus]|uniref:invasion associated locus B family protein n=1 Tax=Pelagibius marinus TaxID=2762760 RepID=UPI001872A150|nr:invasion associated locus B family protein [Pelagibius marinus]